MKKKSVRQNSLGQNLKEARQRNLGTPKEKKRDTKLKVHMGIKIREKENETGVVS